MIIGVSTLRIGIDFDNTIAGYDSIFAKAARKRGLIPCDFTGTKKEIRDSIRLAENGELEWQLLQAEVYGSRMAEAEIFDGVGSFLDHCRLSDDTTVYIVSHKTEYSHFDPLQVNLRAAAHSWMESHRFFAKDGFVIPEGSVYFEATREEKLARIASLKCTHFIDDLIEVLSHPAFPPAVERFLFTNGALDLPDLPYRVCAEWAEIEEAIFDGER